MNFQETIRNAAAQGAVLLRNENNTLPLTANDKVSVFGRCQINFYKSGTGSGGSVNVPYTVNLIQGFEKLSSEGFECPQLNEELIHTYKQWVKENPFDNGGGGWASEPWCQKDMILTPQIVKAASEKSEKAVFVIGRTAGEDQDNKAEAGSYFLTEEEKSNLKEICKEFKQVIILLNVANIMDLSWIDDKEYCGHISAVLFVWQGGMEAGSGAADVLCGKVNPSGKLSDTIAYSYSDYPCSNYFGSATDEFYAEDIYVGYRYFSTFAEDKVQFPFGFGLSYTEFKISSVNYLFPSLTSDDINRKNFADKKFCVEVEVKNSGKVSGSEVVQCYVNAPQGKLGKSKRVLAAFKKTPVLEPGKSCTLKMEFNLYRIASYDDSGVTGFPYSYVLEDGIYSVYVGNSIADCKKIVASDNKEFEVKTTFALEILSQNCAPEKSFEILKPGVLLSNGMYEETKVMSSYSKVNLEEKIKQNVPEEIKYEGNKNITFQQLVKDNSLIDEFISQLTVNEMETLVRGEGMMSCKVTSGIASAFGGVSQKLRDKGIPAVGCSDGPSGIRMDNGKEASLVPIGTLLACTWNPELVEQLYSFLGKEMAEKKIDVLLGPGCNIHRSPLNGRNFEYFSEDPLVTGLMAGAIIKGLLSQGAIGTLKHFALNNQESNRRNENSVASERAIREIYLKPFEMAVKEAGALSIMTSYNGVNGHWSASNYELVSSILRGEWNYKGCVMTDWWAAMNDCISGGKPTVKNISQMVRARNDVYMVVVNDSAEEGVCGDNLHEAIENKILSLSELQACAKDILLFLTKTYAAQRELGPLRNKIHLTSSQQLPEGKEISPLNQEIPVVNNQCEIYFCVEEKGDFVLQGTFSKDGDEYTLSQSISNVVINGESYGSFDCRSTDGKLTSAIACLMELEKGIYKIQLDHTKPGIEVKGITLNQKK